MVRDVLMHVTPSELKVLRQDRTVVRFALIGGWAFVLADISAGSAGTAMEAPCTKPHWGFVNAGELVHEADGRRQVIPAGSAFHVPGGGPPHRFHVSGQARISGFEPVDPAVDTSDEALAARGLEPGNGGDLPAAVVVPAPTEPITEPDTIEARSWRMSQLVLAEARFGPGSGYTTQWCDAPHWGLVTAGRLAIEWESDVEIVAAGDVYHCPGGPPGHRLEAADPASVIDLTPASALRNGRVAQWRVGSASAAKRPPEDSRLALASLG